MYLPFLYCDTFVSKIIVNAKRRMFLIQLCSLLIVVIIRSSDGYLHDDEYLFIDELDNYICPDDLREFLRLENVTASSTPLPGTVSDNEVTSSQPVPDSVDCFGLGSLAQTLFNMRPGTSSDVNTEFYFSSRSQPQRVQVFPGNQFNLDSADFDPKRRTIMIVHGFMSYSNATWVQDMTRAFLTWSDVNIIAVDWSKGGNTWKYWRAVANTRRVGSDVAEFLRLLMARTGTTTKDFHFVGHSLGAHISSYVSLQLGRVARITGLDPAQPCFQTSERNEKLDDTDADFVDVIHTNSRLMMKIISFGMSDPLGHADFYPNGGMKQPGCFNRTNSLLSRIVPYWVSKLQQAICSHGRAYLLFTESLINNNCTFRAQRWNLTYEGVNASLEAACDGAASCAEMGITAVGGPLSSRATGPYFVLTTEKEPYCPTESQREQPFLELLWGLRNKFYPNSSTDGNEGINATKKTGFIATICNWWGKLKHVFV